MPKAIFISLLLCLSLAIAHAQTFQRRDSLLQLLKATKADTNRCKQLGELAIYYQMNNQDSSQYYLDQSKALSLKLNYTKGIYRYYEQSVVLDFTKGEYSKAITHSDSTIAYANKLNDKSLLASAYANLGITYNYLGKYNDAINAILQSKNIFESIGDSSKLSPIYHNLANCYMYNYQYKKALENALISIQIHEQYGKPNRFINRVYSTAAQSWQALGQYDSAQKYYAVAISKSKTINDKIAEATLYSYIADLNGLQKNFQGMLAASSAAYSIATELQSRQMQAATLNSLAHAHLYNGHLPAAQQYLDEAITISKADSLLKELHDSYAAQSFISVAKGNYALAYAMERAADSIQQLILNSEVVKASADLEKKYETEKKEAQIKSLENEKKLQLLTIRQQHILNYSLIAGAIILVIISVLLYRNYHHKQKLQQQRINELETEKQLAATEAVLKGEEIERTRLAKDLHDGLGGMLSGIKYSLNTMKGNLIMTPENAQAFERSIDMLDSSIQEMRRVAHNMMPEALVRFGLDTALKDFCNDINQSGALQINYQSYGMEHAAIEQTTAITIYRVVQELINNTMKHAAAQHAIVQVTKTDGHLSVTVEDDGKGFDTSILKGTKGIGWSSIQNRVEFLKGKMDVDSAPGRGTSVLIELEG